MEKYWEPMMSVAFLILVTEHLTRSNLKNERFFLSHGLGGRVAGAPKADDYKALAIR